MPKKSEAEKKPAPAMPKMTEIELVKLFFERILVCFESIRHLQNSFWATC